MKLLLFYVLMVCFALAQVFGEENEPKEAEYWTSRHDMQDGWISNDPFREILLRMTRKPRPHQFIGLMGKRSMANAQITRKRHKVNSFVGLMGKRSQEEPECISRKHAEGEDVPLEFVLPTELRKSRLPEFTKSYEWSTIQTYDERR